MTTHVHYFHGKKEHSTTYAAASLFMPGAAARVEAIRAKKRKLKHPSPPPAPEAPSAVATEDHHAEEVEEAHEHETDAQVQEQAQSTISDGPIATNSGQVHESEAAVPVSKTVSTPSNKSNPEEELVVSDEFEKVRSESSLEALQVVPTPEPEDAKPPEVPKEVDVYLVHSASETPDLEEPSRLGVEEEQTGESPEDPESFVETESIVDLAISEAEADSDYQSKDHKDASSITALEDTEDAVKLNTDNDMTTEQPAMFHREELYPESEVEPSEPVEETGQLDCPTATCGNGDEAMEFTSVEGSASNSEPDLTDDNESVVDINGDEQPIVLATPELLQQTEVSTDQDERNEDEIAPQMEPSAPEGDIETANLIEDVAGEDELELKLDTSVTRTSTRSPDEGLASASPSSPSSPSGRMLVKTKDIEWVKRSEFD